MVLLVLAFLFIIALLWGYRYRNDEYLARYIAEMNNERMKGRMEMGRVHWNARSLVALAVGVPIPVQVDHFAVYDPRGQRVLYVPRATATVDLLSLITGGHLLLSKLKVERVYCNVAQVLGKGKTVVGLVEAFSSKNPSMDRSPRVELEDFDIAGARLLLSFDGWSVRLDKLATQGSFRLTGGSTEVEGVLFDLTAKATSGELTVAGYSFPLEGVNATRFTVTQDKPMDLLFHIATRVAGAPVKAQGRLTNTYRGNQGVEMSFSVRGAQGALARVMGPGVSGAVQASGQIMGPLAGPRIKLQASGGELSLQGQKARKLQGRLDLDLARGTLEATLLQGELWGGRFSGGGRLNLGTGDWSGTARLTGFNPATLSPTLAGTLQGEVTFKGSLHSMSRSLAVLDLSLARRQRDYLPSRVTVTGSMHLGTRILNLAGVRLRGDGASLDTRGTVDINSGKVDLHLDLKMPRLGAWLARRRLLAIAKSAKTTLHVTGRYPALRAAGSLQAGGVGYGVLRLPSLRARVKLSGDNLELQQIRSAGYGGRLSGGAVLTLFRGDLLRIRRRPSLRGHITAEGLDLAALGVKGATGAISGKAQIAGPVDELIGTADLRLPWLEYRGERFEGAMARIGLLKDRVSIYQSSFPRKGGGRLIFWGDVFYDQRLALRLKTDQFPLAAIPYVTQIPLGLGGRFNGQVNVNGTLKNPRLAGTVRLNDARVRGMKMGSGTVTLTSGSDTVHIKGHLLGRLLKLDGYLLTDPRARLHLKIDVSRFPLEKLLYEMRQVGDVRGRVSGSIRLDADSRDGLTWADARFSQLDLSLRYRPPGERKTRMVRLVNQQDLLARYDGRQLHVVTAKLVTKTSARKAQQAVFTVGGWISPKQADMRLRGMVALELLEFFLEGKIQKLSGGAVANVKLSGPTDDLSLEGILNLNRIEIRMPRFDQVIEIPHGRVRLVPGFLHLDSFGFRVGQDVLKASGNLALKQFRPQTADLRLSGDLNVKLVELFFGRHVSHAVGSTSVKLKVEGPVKDPRFAGELKIKQVEVSPRGWGRTITLNKGKVTFDNWVISTDKPLEGTYDEGLISVAGEVRHDRFDVADIDLQITGTGIPQRRPKVYTAELNLDVNLLGDSRQLQLQGEVELVDVRYVRKFDVLRRALIKPRVSEEETPFWKGSPVLEGLKLKIDVRSTGQILVKNNLAQLSLSGDFAVGGTLADTRLDGVIRAEEGTFKLPYTRGEFTISRGEIVFKEIKPIDQGEISITSEMLYEGRKQEDYTITLKVKGSLSGPAIQISSRPVLDPGQLWALLALGMTTDQLRSSLGGGGDAGEGGALTGGIADAQVKQLTGEILSSIVEDPLKKVTRLDVISLEVGTESAQIRAGKRLGRYLKLDGEYELGILGDSRAEGRLEVRMHDLLKLVGKWERLSTRLETAEEDPSRGRIELKLSLPLR